jgi:hypothetical protein
MVFLSWAPEEPCLGVCESLQFEEPCVFPWKSDWKVKTLPRMAFYTWMIVLGRILTMDNLIRRDFILVNWCCLESVNHLLLQFEYTNDLWHMVLNMFRIL